MLAAIRDSGRAVRLVQISIPGTTNEDRTAFSQTKREAERLIAVFGLPYAMLRPGFVVAPSAYGGSAMLRALAAFPPELPENKSAMPFQPVAVEEIAATIAWLARAMSATTLKCRHLGPDGPAADHARQCDRTIPLLSFGTATISALTLPGFLLELGAKLGDLADMLGGRRRCAPPRSLNCVAALPAIRNPGCCNRYRAEKPGAGRRPARATIQDKWFARLFLVKALVIASLVVFWIVSGFIALVISFASAAEILR